MLNFAKDIFFLSAELALIWVIYYQISPYQKRTPFWWFVSLVYAYISSHFIDSYWVLSLFPFFIFYELKIRKTKSISFAFFIAIYTCFIPLLLLTTSSMFFYALPSIPYINDNNFSWVVLSILLALLIHILVINIFKVRFSILEKNDVFIQKRIIMPSNIALIIGLSLFLIPFSMENGNSTDTPMRKYTTFLLLTNLFLLVSLLFFLSIQAKRYLQREVQRVKEEQYEQLNNYTKEIEGLYRQIRGFRHDFGNILASLGESIHSGNIEEIQQTYDDIMIKANLDLNKKNYNIAELTNISNSAIKSVLSAKMMQAEQKSIHVNVEVKNNIEDFVIETLDYVRILSILLDNAIEAAEYSEAKKLNLAIFENNHQVITIISNSRNSKEHLTIQSIQNPCFSTKGEHRGTGLQNVKQIIEKYSNTTIDTQIKDSEFIQTVIFTRKE